MIIKDKSRSYLLVAAHFGAIGITPSCCVLCLHRNLVIYRSKLLTSEGKAYTGGVSFVAAVGAKHTSYFKSSAFVLICVLQHIGRNFLSRNALTETENT